jgi:hypothetical protein
MTIHNPITNIDLTIKEIYDEYTNASIMHLWESRHDETQSISTLTFDLKNDLAGLLTTSLQRLTIRRMFSEGYTMMMVPPDKFKLLDDASSASKDFTISIFDDNAKLILVLTTDEVSW